MRRRELGYCQVSCVYGGSWSLPRDEYTRVRAAWLKGAPFVDTVGFHGEAMTIRLSDVDSISDHTPDVVMASVEEARADAADDSVAGSA